MNVNTADKYTQHDVGVLFRI